MRENPYNETQEARLLSWKFKHNLHLAENKRMFKSLEIPTGNQQIISLSLSVVFIQSSGC